MDGNGDANAAGAVCTKGQDSGTWVAKLRDRLASIRRHR
jgi:hypothetical protein